MTRAILDGDVVAYQACAVVAGASAVRWDDDTTSGGATRGHAMDAAHDKVKEWMGFAGADRCTIAFSGESSQNFRRGVNPEYKATRVTDKPEHYEYVVAGLKDHYEHLSEPGLEGDDIMGLLLTGPAEEEVVAVSTDKDILTLPGLVLRVPHSLKKDVVWGYVENSEVEANRYWMYQTLVGDRVDEYRGCPGVGPKRAQAVLKGLTSLDEMWGTVVAEYHRHVAHKKWGAKFQHRGSALREALMNARCARILRWGDYSFDTQEVKLWMP